MIFRGWVMSVVGSQLITRGKIQQPLTQVNASELAPELCIQWLGGLRFGGWQWNFLVLFTSGYTREAIHTNFVLDKGVHLIQKPFTRAELLRKLRELLD